MWDHRYLSRIDFRTIPILLVLMLISILVIAATTGDPTEVGEETLFTPVAKSQMRWFAIGWAVYLFLQDLTTASSRNGPGSSILACWSC